MVFSVNKGRDKKCKDTVGGLRAIYLAPYRKWHRAEVIYDGAEVTQFPATFIYRFELVSTDVFDENGDQNEGGKFYNQALSCTFNKLTPFDNLQFQKLLRKDYFLVVQDNNGHYRLLGFKNGVLATNLTTSSEQQYTISFEGMELELAPFIDSIMGEDFIIIEGENYIFQDEHNFIFQDDYNYIFQN